MISKNDLIKISDYVWEIPKSFRQDMRVAARIYASSTIITEVLRDRSLEQLVNVATLPGIKKYALVMPDVHEGYGFPVGGVAAFGIDDGVISPGGIGYDINCGVRLLRSTQKLSEIKPYLARLGQGIYKKVPSGVGRGGNLKLEKSELNEVLTKGAPWLVERGYGDSEDLQHTESLGKLEGADSSLVSDHAKARGADQLGTMGAGNHFVEIDQVEKIFDEKQASLMGLFENQVVFQIHTGSRGLGHQIATDYIKVMVQNLPKFKINLPDRELACAPFASPEGHQYFSAMAAAANFAWANRQFITWEVRSAWRSILGEKAGKLYVVYDVAHNIAKLEDYEIDGKPTKCVVHRKGATRAFPGQPVLIPGSMGTASYVLVGQGRSLMESFGSSCHGAGRRMSRTEAKRRIGGKQLKQQLAKMGVQVNVGSLSALAEEAPLAYKDVDEVVDVVNNVGLAKKVALLKPLAVIKG